MVTREHGARLEQGGGKARQGGDLRRDLLQHLVRVRVNVRVRVRVRWSPLRPPAWQPAFIRVMMRVGRGYNGEIRVRVQSSMSGCFPLTSAECL